MQYGFTSYNCAPEVPEQMMMPSADQMHGGYGEGHMMQHQHHHQQQQQWGQQQQQQQQQHQQQQQQWHQNDGMMMQQQQPMMEQMPMDQGYDPGHGQPMAQMGMGGDMMHMQHGSEMMHMPMGGEMMHHPGQQSMSGYLGGPPAADDDKGISKNTVYVGGLPIPGAPDGAEAVDEAGLHNFFFAHCGPIKGIRMQPNRGCCFVEFENDTSASQAVQLNGTHAALRPDLPSSTIRIMVRFAYARPKRAPGHQLREQHMAMRPGHDGYGMGGMMSGGAWDASGGGMWADGGDWRTGTRWDLSAAGSRWQAQAGRPRSPSPERIPRYTESENRKLKELLKKSVEEIESMDPNSMSLLSGAPSTGGGILLHAINTVVSWMEAGECGKKTADNFYVYLQHIHAKVLELQKFEEQRAKLRQDEDQAFYTSLNAQHDAALKAFNEARKQKVKDNFSKVQRKNVDRWVAAAVGGSRKYSSLLGIAMPEEDMEVEAQRIAQAGHADEPGSPEAPDAPPPPPSTGEQRQVKRQKPEEQQQQQQQAEGGAEGNMSALSSRINALERLLMEKLDGKAEKAEFKADAQEAKQEATAVKQEAGSAAPAAAPSATDPMAVCVVAALAMYMASFPKGAKLSQLCAYVSSLCHTEGDAAEAGAPEPLEERSVESMVKAALSLAPGVFTQAPTTGGDPIWSLTALQMLQRVKAT